MKSLLIEADFKREVRDRKDFFTMPSAPSFGINYLASVLRGKGHEVIVLDALYEYLRTDFDRLIDINKGALDIIKGEKDIDCVGISITSPTRNYAIDLAKDIKNLNAEIKIIGGGPHITILQELFLNKFSKVFDLLVIGESDKTFPMLVDTIANNKNYYDVPGIVFRNKRDEIIKNNPLDVLNTQQLNNINIVPYTEYAQYQKFFYKGNIPAISLVTSRGCPFDCNFCYSPRLWQKYREHSYLRVIEEIEYLIDNYKVKNIRFQDDTFTFNKSRCINIFKEIKKKQLNIEIYMHTRFDCIDKEIIEAYASAGGKDIYFGLEAGTKALRSKMGKKNTFNNRKILEICKIVKDYDLNIGLWLITGYPGETEDDIKMACDLLSKIDPDEVNCNPAHVHPNTPLFNKAKEEGIYQIGDWINGKNDFFPYYKGEKGLKSYLTCLSISKQFSKNKIRTVLEQDIETTLGGNNEFI